MNKTFFTKSRARVLRTALMAGLLLVPAACAQTSQPAWKEYLETLKKGWVPYDYEGDMKELRLIDYTYKGELNSEEDKSRVIDAMFADDAPVSSVVREIVVRDTTITETDTLINWKRYPAFEIVTMRQKIDEGKLTEDSISNLKRVMKENAPMGTGYLELVWNYKGKDYRVTSIIADEVPVDCIVMGLYRGKGSSTKSVRKP